MLNIDENQMEQVAQEAFNKVTGNRRWEIAIAKALQQIKSNPFMHFNGDALLILSDSNEIYTANYICQCKAFKSHQPCWHRAAARLVRRYMETSH